MEYLWLFFFSFKWGELMQVPLMFFCLLVYLFYTEIKKAKRYKYNVWGVILMGFLGIIFSLISNYTILGNSCFHESLNDSKVKKLIFQAKIRIDFNFREIIENDFR